MPRVLLIDCFDSFTYMLGDYLQQCGAEVVVVRCNDGQLKHTPQADGVLLSPGPGTPQAAGLLMPFVTEHLQQLPMLGICLGHQALGLALGGRLQQSPEPWHGRQSVVNLRPHAMFAGLPPAMPVGRYHSLIVDGLPLPEVISTATDAAGCCMALAHKRFPLWGVQFHPESIMSTGGLQVLKNWVQSLPT